MHLQLFGNKVIFNFSLWEGAEPATAGFSWCLIRPQKKQKGESRRDPRAAAKCCCPSAEHPPTHLAFLKGIFPLTACSRITWSLEQR